MYSNTYIPKNRYTKYSSGTKHTSRVKFLSFVHTYNSLYNIQHNHKMYIKNIVLSSDVRSLPDFILT